MANITMQHLFRFEQILKKFCENHLTVDGESIDRAQILSMCKYYEELNGTIREFESRLDQLKEDHLDVKKIWSDAESVEDCMKLGNAIDRHLVYLFDTTNECDCLFSSPSRQRLLQTRQI